MAKIPVGDPFQDTQDPFAEDETPTHQAERLSIRAQKERLAQGAERRTTDVLVDRKLIALKVHVETLQRQFGDLVGSVDTLTGTVAAMKTGQDKNNEMTEKMLGIIGGGKMLVSLIKFLGVIAVPITAIVTAVVAIRHGFG